MVIKDTFVRGRHNMKLVTKLLLILALVKFSSCSKSQSTDEATEDPAGVEISDSEDGGGEDSLELEEDGEGGDAAVADSGDAAAPGGDDEIALDDSTKSLEEVAPPTDDADKTSSSDYVASSAETPAGTAIETAGGPVASTSSGSADGSGIGDATYKVQPNETLMLIAFKLYGDYSKWKEIASLNQDKLKGNNLISTGMDLRYNSQGAGFSWNPQGKEHVVQRGDTLSLISNQYYGTLKKWKMIWENNKPLIKDPNKIFIGFTVFVPEEGMRDMASTPLADAAAPPSHSETAPQATDPSQSAKAQAPAATEDFPEDI